MPADKKVLTLPGSRFDVRELTAKVMHVIERRGMDGKEVYGHFGWDRSTWSIKQGLKRSQLTIPEFGVIAELLKMPTAWPFLDERLGATLDRILDGDAEFHAELNRFLDGYFARHPRK